MTDIAFIYDDQVNYGTCERLSPLVRRVVCPNPSPFTYTGTGTFIIGNGIVAILEPGPQDESHLTALLNALEPGETVSHILVTHTHADHSPLAMPLKSHTNALIGGALRPPTEATDEAVIAMEEAIDESFTPDLPLKEGDTLTGPDWTLEVIETPGHISNHLCFALPEEKTLFTGDHIMAWATSVVIPPDGNMNDYMTSLKKLLSRDDQILRPTHGPAITQARPFIESYISHRTTRESQILSQLESGKTQIKAIVKSLYTDTDPKLHPAAAMSVWAHLESLVASGTVSCQGTPRLNSHYRLAKALK